MKHMNDDNVQKLPGDSPTDGVVGTYQAQFESIRTLVCSEIQQAGAEYAMNVQKLVRTCLNANLQIASLSEQHCNNLLERFKACRAKLVSHTNNNAMFAIDDRMLLVDFDLSKSEHAMQSARFLQPSVFASQLAIASELLLIKQLQILFFEPIDETSIVIPYQQCMDSVGEARRQLNRSRELLRETIASRAFTAFDFKKGLSLYTLNFSDDMSMLFWDRYTIIDSTMKSYYIEQHCIVEHTINGVVEPERYIATHKPSKNSMAQFYADRLACLLSMVRPEPTVEEATSEVPVEQVDDDKDELFTDEELVDMGYTEQQIEEYHQAHQNDNI